MSVWLRTLYLCCVLSPMHSAKVNVSFYLLVISPEMTCKTGQMSVRPCLGVNIFNTLRLWYCWADVDEAWQVYSVGLGTKLLGSGVLLFGRYAVRERWRTQTGVLIHCASSRRQLPTRNLWLSRICRRFLTVSVISVVQCTLQNRDVLKKIFCFNSFFFKELWFG